MSVGWERRSRPGVVVGAGGVACVVVVVVCMAACSAEPTVMETPKIVWQDGIEPSSQLESNELVQVARRAEIGISMAWNTGDFTIAQLVENFGSSLVSNLAEGYAAQGDDVQVYPGPVPWEPVEIIEEYDDGGGQILICAPNIGEAWFIRPDGGAFGQVEPDGDLQTITVRREAGRLKFVESDLVVENGKNNDCDASDVAVGLFDPVPELPDVPVTKTVRDPRPAEG